jgi:hypothetical protein
MIGASSEMLMRCSDELIVYQVSCNMSGLSYVRESGEEGRYREYVERGPLLIPPFDAP